MRTVYTAIFGGRDELKDPTVVTPGWRYVCYTDRPYLSEVWDVRVVPVRDGDPVRTARWYKIMYHAHLEPGFSLWVDGSFRIATDLDAWCDRRYTPPMTCVAHPIRRCVYEEAVACIKNRRGAEADIRRQMAVYHQLGVPGKAGLIASGVLMREDHPDVRRLCEIWWDTVATMSTRDQLGFAYAARCVRVHHEVAWDYRTAKDLIFTGHKKR